MSKNTITRPNTPRPKTPQGPGKTPSDPKLKKLQQGPSAQSLRNAKAKEKAKADKAPKVSAPKAKSPRVHGAHAAHAEHHDDEGAGGAHGLGGVEASEDHDLHRRRHVEVELVHEEDEIEEHEEVHETAAVGPDAITRSQGDSNGDGFEGSGDKQREAYERYMRGNVANDKERFDELRKRGTRDDFNPELAPPDVEALGVNRATAHVVRIYEKWTLDGVPREEALQKAADLLGGFTNVTNIRKVLAELESKPIRDVYPLEVLMRMLDARPELLPGVRPGSVIGNAADMRDGNRVLAGVPMPIPLPPDVRLKSFALLGGARPGYEFAPHVDGGKYSLLVDTPGRWTFAVLAAPLQQLGRIQRETNEAILELFTVVVHAMGKKGEPLTPEQWQEQQALEGVDVDDEPDDVELVDEERPVAEAPIAPNLPVQIRRALESIRKDEGSSTAATTYSWDASFYKPGAPMAGEPILHLVVDKAGPFDQAWVKAREALAHKQKEYEPGRALVTAEDFTAALRRARVR